MQPHPFTDAAKWFAFKRWEGQTAVIHPRHSITVPTPAFETIYQFRFLARINHRSSQLIPRSLYRLLVSAFGSLPLTHGLWYSRVPIKRSLEYRIELFVDARFVCFEPDGPFGDG